MTKVPAIPRRSVVQRALTEGRALEGGRLVGTSGAGLVMERLVLAYHQLAERGTDGLGGVFEWEAEQRALGREVFFHDDKVLGRIVFESRLRKRS